MVHLAKQRRRLGGKKRKKEDLSYSGKTEWPVLWVTIITLCVLNYVSLAVVIVVAAAAVKTMSDCC